MHNGLLSLSLWPTWTLIARIYSSKAWLSGDKAWLTQAAVFLPTHLAFIRTESFFRAAELIGLRFAVWTNIGLLFAAPPCVSASPTRPSLHHQFWHVLQCSCDGVSCRHGLLDAYRVQFPAEQQSLVLYRYAGYEVRQEYSAHSFRYSLSLRKYSSRNTHSRKHRIDIFV